VKLIKTVFLVSFVLTGLVQAAPISPMNGYTTTDHSKDKLGIFWTKLKDLEKKMKGKDCFKRANIWSYKLWREDGVKSKKIFMHYTNKFNRELDNLGRSGLASRIGGLFSRNIAWDFHVAPAVTIDGVDYVFDPYLRKEPQLTIDWVEHLTKRGEYRLKKRKSDSLKKLGKLRKKLARAQSRDSEAAAEKAYELRVQIRAIQNEMQYLGLNEDSDQIIDIKCKRIDHIMEFDRAQDSEWCFYQEASMYYFATRELRFLNYGVLSGVDQRHPIQEIKFHTEENFNNGKNYVVERWEYSKLLVPLLASTTFKIKSTDLQGQLIQNFCPTSSRLDQPMVLFVYRYSIDSLFHEDCFGSVLDLS
jgi:hypothetical protein